MMGRVAQPGRARHHYLSVTLFFISKEAEGREWEIIFVS